MQKYIQFAAFLAMLAVILGAFGAHALKAQLNEAQLASYQTGIRYHFYHILAVFVLIILQKQYPKLSLRRPIQLMFVGILLFSGSIYLLSCRQLLGIENWGFLGPITPIGGMCFIVAWAWVMWVFSRKN